MYNEPGGNSRIELLRRFNAALKRIEELEALLRELINIEGPQPGTSDWANKVHAALKQEQDK